MSIPEIEPVMALGIAHGIAQSNRWVLSSPPWVSQLRNGCHCTAKWHSCAKTTFAIAKYPAEWDFRCEITLFHFTMRFAAAKWMQLYCEVALVCQIHFRSCETPSQRLLQCCGMVWQQNAHFAEVSFTLRNFAELCFSPVFALFRLQFRPDFFSFQFP